MASRLDFSQIRSLYIGGSASQTVPTNNVIVDGNVLIGTTTDSGYKLNILGKVGFNTDGTMLWGNAFDYGKLTWDTGKAIVRGESGKALSLGANGTQDYVYITTAGNVGIGTTSPIAKLHISSSGDPSAAAIMGDSKLVVSGVDGNMDLFSADDNSTVACNIGFGRFNGTTGALIHKFGITSWANTGSTGSNTGNRLSFNYGTTADVWSNTELMSITSGGNVLIGTTTDSGYKLRVNGNSYQDGAATFASTAYVGSTLEANGTVVLLQDTNDLIFQQTNTSTHGIVWKNLAYTKDSASIRPTGNGAWATQGIGFYTGNAGDSTTAPSLRFNIQAGGDSIFYNNVGIGTTGPLKTLNVYTGNPSGATTPASDTAILIDSAANQYLEFRTASASSGLMQGLLFTDNGRNAFIGFKEYTGAVAGTYGESVHFSITDYSSSDAGSGFYFGTSSNNENGVTNPLVFLRSNGNMMIGTTTDSGYKLDVNGTARINGTFVTNLEGTYGQGILNELVSTYVTRTLFGRKTSTSNLEIYYDIFGSEEARITRNYTNAVLKFNRGTTTDMILDNAGNVGIGLTNPDARLAIVSDSGGNAISIRSRAPQDDYGWLIYESNDGSERLAEIGSYRTAASTAALLFYTNNGSGAQEAMRINNTKNILIGTTTDSGYKLRVNGNSYQDGAATFASTLYVESNLTSNSTVPFTITSNGNGDTYTRTTIYANQNNTSGNTANGIFIERGRLTDSGSGEIRQFVIGARGGSIQWRLDGNGNSSQTGSLAVGTATPSGTAGRIDASNDIVAYSSSDKRLKENITPIANALDKVKAITGVEFDWRPEHKEAHGYEGHDTGVIAQEVKEVMPSAVRENETGFLAVRYEKLIGLLIEANKELANRVEELEKKLK